MQGTVYGINAGKHRLYEVVDEGQGLPMTIREAHNHERAVTILRSALPSLVEVLQKLLGHGASGSL